MSKLKSFRKLVVRPCDHTEQEYEEYCDLLEKAGVMWQAGERPEGYNFPPSPNKVVILDTRTMKLSRGVLGVTYPDRCTTTIQYAMFLLEDHLYEQA